jgi:allantoicase
MDFCQQHRDKPGYKKKYLHIISFFIGGKAQALVSGNFFLPTQRSWNNVVTMLEKGTG